MGSSATSLIIQGLRWLIEYLEPGHFVLKSKDGKFQCTPDSAVEEAYLLNCAEGAIDRNPSDKWEIGHIMVSYLDNSRTLERTMEAINEDIDDDRYARQGH